MQLSELFTFLSGQPLLLLAMVAILISVLGAMLAASVPWLSKLLRGIGNLGLLTALLLTIAQAARLSNDSDFNLALAGMKEQRVEGGETRVPMSPDGHFWLKAKVNGVERRFLVDTGATITALTVATAQTAGVEPQGLGRTVMLQTANGAAAAQMASIAELRFGNVTARDLDAVIAPNIGETNVIGMNLLSRLASWRVEGKTLILVPADPQPEQ